VWIYCIVWWFIQDACKVVTYMILRKYNVFQINTSQMVNVRGAQTFQENPLARQSAGSVEVGAGACPLAICAAVLLRYGNTAGIW
jgi:H+-transporting ATPase